MRKIPDQNTRRTSVHTKAVDPVYNDLFTFHIGPRDDVTCHVLIYGLHHVDKFSASHLRGEACLPLFQIDLNSRRRVNIPFVEIKVRGDTTFWSCKRLSIEKYGETIKFFTIHCRNNDSIGDRVTRFGNFFHQIRSDALRQPLEQEGSLT